ncbi:MAG: MFS transporter [Rubrobacter sp.]
MRSIRGKPNAALLVVTFAIFVDLMVYGLMVPVLPLYASELGASRSATGLLLGAYGLAVVVATPLFGVLADRFGSKRPMVLGLLGLAAATLLFAYAPGLGWLFVARILQGVSAAASWVAGLALLASVFPADQRGRAMGTALAGTAVGTLLGPPLGGLLYDWGGLRLPFFVAASLAALDGVARLSLTVEERRQEQRERFAPGILFSDRVVLLGGVAVLLAAGANASIEPVLPLHLSQALGATPTEIGLLFGASTLAFGVFSPAAGTLSDRLGRLAVVGLGLLATGVSLPLLVASDSLWVEALAMGVFGVAVGLALAPTMPFLADAAERRGSRATG